MGWQPQRIRGRESGSVRTVWKKGGCALMQSELPRTCAVVIGWRPGYSEFVDPGFLLPVVPCRAFLSSLRGAPVLNSSQYRANVSGE